MVMDYPRLEVQLLYSFVTNSIIQGLGTVTYDTLTQMTANRWYSVHRFRN